MARQGAGSARRPSPRPPALPGLLLLCLWLPSGRASGPPAAPLSELHAQLSGVEQLLEDFRRQLQQERPLEELELELRADGGAREGCPGAGGDGYSAMPDAIIRTKDSLAAGASFLRAPAAVRDWRQCVAACCSEPRCSVAVVVLPRRPAPPAAALGCYLFNCTARGRSVCKFALHRGYSTYALSRAPGPDPAWASPRLDKDEPPHSKAGKDVALRLPADQVVLDGRESTDDHAIVQYEWTLLQGDPTVDMKVPQPGTLKLSHLQEGTYTFQLTVTDTVGQRSSDNVSVTVHPRTYSMGGCSNVCSRYHFFCDDGCCIDITLACDGVRQCPDGSDEDFCQNLGLDRKMAPHTEASSTQPGTTGLSEDAGDPWLEKSQKVTSPNQPATLSHTEKRNHSTEEAPESKIIPIMPEHENVLAAKNEIKATSFPLPAASVNVHMCRENSAPGHPKEEKNFPGHEPFCKDPYKKNHLQNSNSSGKNRKEENYIFESKSDQGRGEHPAPEAGAVLPLALGLAVTVLLLLMAACRLRLVRQKLKRARPITPEESDYLINGMYL